MTRADLLPLVKEISASHKLDFRLVDAIVMTESSYNIYAIKFEKDSTLEYSVDIFAQKTGFSSVAERCFQHTSWGLAQMMGFKARERGFKGFFTAFCEPRLNLEFGCKLIADLCKKYPLLTDAIASYNSGSPIRKLGGGYVNQKYIDRVLTIYRAPL